MAKPSDQVLASWVKEELQSRDWILLRTIAVNALVRKTKWPEDTAADYIDEQLSYLAEVLRNDLSDCLRDGRIQELEIDDEASPYIRRRESRHHDILGKLRSINPFLFEQVCSRILDSLGAKDSFTTQKTNDGGVDFIATNFKFVASALPMPLACHCIVLGQAKRYKDGYNISEIQLREFVGAAVLQRHILGVKSQLSPLAPTLFAFWTTSDLDRNAREFARGVGIWYMDGVTLGSYAESLKLRDYIMSLPED